ncbi:MAG: GntR family transcriptional regulator [Mailhella sp.]|nr:GntR family transcriptional regulator [Mailhella sp.]
MSNSTKADLAYTLIRDGILSGEFLPGSHLILVDLEKKLCVGRGPIRDALMRLDKSGLIENLPFKGAVVKRPPSIEELEIIYRTRFVLERQAILEAMRNISARDVDILQKMIDESRCDIDSPQKFYAHDRKFHSYIYKTAKMPHIQDIINSINEHIDIYLNTNAYDFSYRFDSIGHHQQMLDAIKEKNIGVLIDTLEENMSIGLKYIYDRITKGVHVSKRTSFSLK